MRTEEKRKQLLMEAMGNCPQGIAPWLEENGFFRQPASTRFHGNYAGGLFDHSYAVMETLLWMTESMGLKWRKLRSPFLVGLFHDLCKIDSYIEVDEDGIKRWSYNRNCEKGHGDKSVRLLSQFLELSEEEELCIRYHMGAYEKEDWKGYDEAIRKYPTVLWTHTADMYASKVLDL